MANRITTVFDFSESGGLKKIKADVDSADTSFGKMKAGFAGAAASIKANAGAMAIGAGAAIVTFGVKAAEQFTNLALDVEKFSTATGLSQDAASRWIEVANDIGITTEQIQGGFVKLEKAIGGNSPAVKALGIEMVTAADGTADVSATMLQAIKALEGVKDPAMKAKLASELFGRGFADMAELVTGDADEIAAAMGKVSGAKLINQDEINKAKKNRETLNELKDTFEDITLQLGESFLPVMEATATAIQSVGTVAGALQLDKIVDGFAKIDDEAFKAGASIRSLFDGGAAQKNQALVAAFESSEEAAANFDTTLLRNVKTFDEARAIALTYADAQGLGENATHAANLIALEWNKTTEDGTDALDDNSDGLVDNTKATDQNAAALQKSIQALNSQEAMLEGTKAAQEAAAAAADLHRQAEENLMNYINGQLSSVFSYETATLDLANANTELATKMAEVKTAFEAGELSGAEYETALRNLRLEEIGTAEQARAVAVAFAESKGASDGSKASAQLQKEELARLQAQFPQLRDEIQAYIDILNRIPTTRTTKVNVVGAGGGRIGADPNNNRALKTGGPIPGPRDAPVPITAHGGEFVLSADVVDAVKRGSPTLGLGAGSAPVGTTSASTSVAVFSDSQVAMLAAAIVSAADSRIGANSAADAAQLRAGVRR